MAHGGCIIGDMLDAILFDFDLTLGRPLGDRTHLDRQVELLRAAGLTYEIEQVQAALEARRREVEAGRLAGTLKPQRMRDLLTLYRHLLRGLGYQGDIDSTARALYVGYARLPFILYDDALPTLRAVVDAGLRVGVISNHTAEARGLIEAALQGLVPASAITISGEVGVHKPRPSLFRRGAQRVGVSAARCAFVGDNREVDAEGAVAAGYAVGVWLDREGAADGVVSPPVYRVQSLTEIMPLTMTLRSRPSEVGRRSLATPD
jgi:FMN phosphatase YigB (HAD superfamily)